MTMLAVGIDISQHTLDVAVCPAKGQARVLGTFPNDPAGFEQVHQVLSETLRRHHAKGIHMVMEPTGGYEQPLALFAYRQGWVISLPNPRQVRDWARGSGIRAKTDRVDACVLAQYAAAHNPPPWKPLPEEVAQLEALLERQEDLRAMLGQERNRRHALKARGTYRGVIAQSLKDSISHLEREVAAIDRAIQEHLDTHPDLKECAKRLQTVPGIGKRNVLFIMVLLYRWSTLTNNQGTSKGVTAYVGLDPLPYESGSSVRRRRCISRQGNKCVRHKLFLGALGGVRGHNPLRDFYQRLVGRGKAKKLALVAAARKILVWAWAVFRDNTLFDPRKATPR